MDKEELYKPGINIRNMYQLPHRLYMLRCNPDNKRDELLLHMVKNNIPSEDIHTCKHMTDSVYDDICCNDDDDCDDDHLYLQQLPMLMPLNITLSVFLSEA